MTQNNKMTDNGPKNTETSRFDYKKAMPRFSFVAIIFTIIAVAVVCKALYLMTVKRGYWLESYDYFNSKFKAKVMPAVRGNILSCDGKLLATSMPEYVLFLDFKAMRESQSDTLFLQKIDSICDGLQRIFPEKSAEEFKENLMEGYNANSRHWMVNGMTKVNYSTYSEVKSLPVFRLPKYTGGFHVEPLGSRKFSYGSLARRTIGRFNGRNDSATCGLELYYDSILRGENGEKQLNKVLNKGIYKVTVPPVDGADIVTTIDVDIQDLTERSLLEELREIDAREGVAIVMEVKTGDVKAISNLTKQADGSYAEVRNAAVGNLMEPGSVFKTASIMVALDDGLVDTTYRVDTYGGIYNMYGSDMKDHNWKKGGYGMLTLPQTLWYSSNVGVSRIIDERYHKCPEKFVQGIYRLGIADSLGIPLVRTKPKIRMPKKNSRGTQYVNWSKTTLPWMSIGYETQIPPISTLAFYNAIANNGKMMRPRFVKEIRKDGVTIKELPPVVLRPQIAKPSTISKIQVILEQVVRLGTGKAAGSKSFAVAGKTGTAQVASGKSGYNKGGVKNYLISFVGYFPADNPQYSCIVCIEKSGMASGGLMCGKVFHDISEGIMAQSIKMEAADAREEDALLTPTVKDGNIAAAYDLLSWLGVQTNSDCDGSYANGNPIWGNISTEKDRVTIRKGQDTDNSVMPDVKGMGARDAVLAVERRGVIVKLQGRGKVVEQSVKPGTKIRKGQVCLLRLA